MKMCKRRCFICWVLIGAILIGCGKTTGNEVTDSVSPNQGVVNPSEDTKDDLEKETPENQKLNLVQTDWPLWEQLETNPIDDYFKQWLIQHQGENTSELIDDYLLYWRTEMYNAADVLYIGGNENDKTLLVERIANIEAKVEESFLEDYEVEEDIKIYVEKYREGYGTGFYDAAMIYKEEALKLISTISNYKYKNMKEDIKNVPIYLWVMNRAEEEYPKIYKEGVGKDNKIYMFQLQSLSYDMPKFKNEIVPKHYALLQVTDEQGNELLNEIICLRSGEWGIVVEDLTGDGIDDIYIYTGEIHYPVYVEDNEGQVCYVWNDELETFDIVTFINGGTNYTINKTYHCLMYFNSTLSPNILRCNAYEYKEGKFVSTRSLEIRCPGWDQGASDYRKDLNLEELFLYVDCDEKQEYIGISSLPKEEYDFWFNSELENESSSDMSYQFPINWVKEKYAE